MGNDSKMKANTIFSKEIKEEDALIEHWDKYIGKNILKGIEILVNLSDNFECIVCPYSQNYTTKGSLAYHLRFKHYKNTVEYIRKNIITKTSDELGDLLD